MLAHQKVRTSSVNLANEVPYAAEKERQRVEKARKLADKQLKQQAAAAAAASKGPKTTNKTTTLPKYVDPTPEGAKKGVPISIHVIAWLSFSKLCPRLI